jgi:predicted RNA-binding Zn ribbon-like protein
VAVHYELVDGIRLPARLGGHPAVEFCNTWAGWDGRNVGDFLTGYDHLAVWAGFQGLLPDEGVAILRRRANRRRREALALLDRARRFRANLYQVLLMGATGPAWEAVAAEVRAAAAAVRLRPHHATIRWEVGTEKGLDAPLLAVAWSAAELLTSPDRSLVRACPGIGCGWLFVDTSGRRRWCTMAICGNRQKARRFAARQRTGAHRGRHAPMR